MVFTANNVGNSQELEHYFHGEFLRTVLTRDKPVTAVYERMKKEKNELRRQCILWKGY